jgi:hypothetical protein
MPPPPWRRPEPALHVAPAGGPGGADGRRQRRRGRAGVGLSSLAEQGARAATTALQEVAGSRDPEGGVRTRHGVKKTAAAAAVAAKGRFPMKTVAEVIGVSRSNLIARMRERPKKRIGRPPLPRRQTRGRDQGGHRRAANLRLPTCPRHPQAPSAGRFFLQHPASKLARR